MEYLIWIKWTISRRVCWKQTSHHLLLWSYEEARSGAGSCRLRPGVSTWGGTCCQDTRHCEGKPSTAEPLCLPASDRSGCCMSTEKAMAPHSSTLAWTVPWSEEPGRLQSMGSIRVGRDWASLLSGFTFMHWRRNGNPLQCSCLENPRDGGAWWAAVYGVAQSRTWPKRLSSSCCMSNLILSTTGL